jgi:cell division protein FtsI/penicillin-binding protein 2
MNMNVTIRRLMSVFTLLFLLISGVAAYVQISNQAFLGGPVLAQGDYDPRKCPPFDAPLRGKIYDRNGVVLAETVKDDTATCGYRRQYYDASLSPLIGYFSYRFGTAGVENTYNDVLSGVNQGSPKQFDQPAANDPGDLNDLKNKILHEPRSGQDIYLTIDEKLQQQANKLYDTHANGSVCQPAGSNPPGSLIITDPRTGEVLAMVSRPFYDPNKIDDPNYFQQLQAAPDNPLLNHATQALYAPGSIFKTVTMVAALDANKASLNNTYTEDEAVNYVVNGQPFRWDDFINGYPPNLQFPITMQDGYAYSDNVIFARVAVDSVGKDTWLSYVRKFGIQTPGVDVSPVPFDAPYAQSSAYLAKTNGKPTDFSPNLLAESGFGQGQLLISPLTMAEVTGAVAANGNLFAPHVVMKSQPKVGGPFTQDPQVYSGGQIFSPDTAAKVRQAMWAVSSYGTGSTVSHNGIHLTDSPVKEGGKTGTAQLESGLPHTWWISLAPDDAAPGGGAAQMVITVMKEHSKEGACQVFVADDTYLAAKSLGYLK